MTSQSTSFALLPASAFVAALLMMPPAFAAKFVTFDPPNSNDTYASAINRKGAVVGFFDVLDGDRHAFLRTPDGNLTSFDPPGCDYTTVAAVNRKGDIAGDSEDSNEPSMYHGFLRTADGGMIVFGPVGSIATSVYALNSHDTTVGIWEDNQTYLHGFVRASSGKIVNIDVSHASDTMPAVINDSGVIAGTYFAHNQVHAFLRTRDGAISNIDPPGATYVE
ncbi:MAG TPA: hypothetical protein VGK90_14235, partial [Rhizomicrobium sp.]